jgi:hypothetical protein
MPPKEELEEVIEYCERRKRETNKVALIEPNIFREKFSWAYRYPFIEIDRGLEVANKLNLVYDSTTKSLWAYINNTWMKLEPEFTEW